MVCCGNVCSMRHIYGTSFDNTGQHIFLKTDARNQCDSGRLMYMYSVRDPKVNKGAKIRNRYNQVPNLTQDTNGKVTSSQLDTTNESQAISPL